MEGESNLQLDTPSGPTRRDFRLTVRQDGLWAKRSIGTIEASLNEAPD